MSKIRDLIQESHQEAEDHPINQEFINGTISDEAYDLYMFQRSAVIKYLDGFLPQKFARYEEFLKDLPENTDNLPVLQATQGYIEHLEHLDEEYIISHLYVNYMGDLHGGQIIRKNNPNRENNHLDFDDIRSDFINHIRNRMHERDEVLAPHAENAFRFIKNILDDVQSAVSNDS